MQTIANILDTINEWIGRALAPLIALIALVVLYDIVLRYTTGRPSDWAFDISKMLFGAHFMLMAAYALRHRAHVEVDVIKQLLSRRRQAIVGILGYLIFFVPFIFLLLYYGWAFAERSFSRLETTPGMVAIPVYPVKMVLVVASVLILLQAISIVLKAVIALREDAR